MHSDTALEAILKRDRLVLVSGIVGISILAWAYMAHMAWGMHGHGMDMAMSQMQAWGVVDLVLLCVMWVVMMVAMMVPTAAPMVLLFATINRRRREQQGPFVPTTVFLLGYLLVWTGFSVVIAVVQWGLHTVALLSPTMVSTSPALGGLLLATAGVFQWTPLKYACLRHCRSPLGFLTTEWREGVHGALTMGLRHGAYCVGCCWVLMSLLFVAGVMNLLWIAAITVFVLVEKVVPRGDIIGRAIGGGLVVAGLLLLSQAWRGAL
jgi:predicted metal-binding membrane protein